MASIRSIPLKNGGAISYQARIHRSGLPMLQKCFPSLAEARRWAAATEAKLDAGESVNAKMDRLTVGAALAAYKADMGDDIKNGEPGMVANLNLDLGEYAISKLTRDIIKAYQERLLATEIPPQPRKKLHPYYDGGTKKTYAKGTVRKYILTLKKALELYSIKEKFTLDKNLFLRLKLPTAWEPRERRLESHEESHLYDTAGTGKAWKEEWRLIIGFALETAARCQEINLAEWDHINFNHRTWWIPPEHSKTAKGRQIPLSSKAVDALMEMQSRKGKDDRIFWPWKTPKSLSKAFHRLAVRAKMPDVHFHTLRHEGTTRLFEKGKLDLMEIASITGHTELKTLSRYTHLLASNLVAKMD